MSDEEDLASLVLLLQLSSSSDCKTDAVELQRALEQDDCKLLCFIGRLLNEYAATYESDVGGVKRVLFRLAVRILFLRYAPHASDQSTAGQYDRQVFEWEKCLLNALLGAIAVNSKARFTIENTDVEIAWSVIGLLMQWSLQKKLGNMTKIKELIAENWIESLQTFTLLIRRQSTTALKTEVEEAEQSSDEKCDVSAPDNDESLMVQTITSLLDDSDESTTNNEDRDWSNQFNIAAASCFRSYLEEVNNPKVTKYILLGLMQWAQQKDVPQLYEIVLQYLSICLHHAFEARNCEGIHSYEHNKEKCRACFFKDANEKSTSTEDVFVHIKSFLFYGLIVLCNEDCVSDTPFETTKMPTTRGDIYSCFLSFWQLLGAEWLYNNALSTSGTVTTVSTANDWWQRSDFVTNVDSSNKLGQTRQLCTLVRLAAGEFRLSIGRWMASVENQRSSDGGIVSEIAACAHIVVETVQLMTSLADDEDEDISSVNSVKVWTPDAVLHTQQSLEDALNAAIQYFNENDVSDANSIYSSSDEARKEWEEIGRTCCLVLGTIAPELELGQLLSSHDKGDYDSHSFVIAMCKCVLFCGSVAEKVSSNKNEVRKLEYEEPLSCILPCIMSIVDIAISDFDVDNIKAKEPAHMALKSLCNEGELVRIISKFLNRLHTRLVESNGQFEQQANIISIVKLSSIIGNGLLEINERSSDADALSAALMQWGV
jgi:hypothetical protein